MSDEPKNDAIKTEREYALTSIRCAALRAKLLSTELEFIGVSLDRKLISPMQALQCVQEAGGLNLLLPTVGDAIATKLAQRA